MALTLVPTTLAAPGFRFTFAGANPGEECKGCPFQRLCFGLAPGHAYEVTALREVTHPCALHESGRVRVVEVREASFPTTLESRLLRGTAATWAPIPCGQPQCPQWKLCHPVGPVGGRRHEITAQGGEVPCPAGFDLTRVELRPMS
jgi:uncharacterized protein